MPCDSNGPLKASKNDVSVSACFVVSKFFDRRCHRRVTSHTHISHPNICPTPLHLLVVATVVCLMDNSPAIVKSQKLSMLSRIVVGAPPMNSLKAFMTQERQCRAFAINLAVSMLPSVSWLYECPMSPLAMQRRNCTSLSPRKQWKLWFKSRQRHTMTMDFV